MAIEGPGVVMLVGEKGATAVGALLRVGVIDRGPRGYHEKKCETPKDWPTSSRCRDLWTSWAASDVARMPRHLVRRLLRRSRHLCLMQSRRRKSHELLSLMLS